MKRRGRKYRDIVRHITTLQLIEPDDVEQMTDEDLFSDLTEGRGSSLFLGSYSRRGILFALRQLGILEHLAAQDLDDISAHVDTSDPFRHRLRLVHRENGQDYLVVETVLRRGTFTFPETVTVPLSRKRYDILVVEWLLLQNPLKTFNRDRPRLPGQDHPGLGLAREANEILYWVGRRAGADGVLIVPNYLHTAYFYSHDFHFVDPRFQAMIEEVTRLLFQKFPLATVAWACEKGEILNRRDSTVLTWTPSEMILPVSRALQGYFYSNLYRTRVSELKGDFDFVLVRRPSEVALR
ncbi:MAG: hypothetical protein ACE5LH_06680 [Fidelibacterota bacterium]